jgi:hypothetical protein
MIRVPPQATILESCISLTDKAVRKALLKLGWEFH